MNNNFTEKEKADMYRRLTDWNYAKHLVRSFLNSKYRANGIFNTAQYPHYKFDNTDLIVTFYLVLRESKNNIDIINVNDTMLKVWNVTVDNLKNAAEFGDKQREYKVESLQDLIEEQEGKIMRMFYEKIMPFPTEYVVTSTNNNKSVNYATSGLVTYDVRQQLKELFPNGCYVFATSIHDTIILDKTSVDKEYTQLLQDDYAKGVYEEDIKHYNPDSEFLTNKVLVFDSKTCTYSTASS